MTSGAGAEGGREVRLTAGERERFENALRWHFNVVAEEGKGSAYATTGIMNAVLGVERILAARLAAVEALAGEWERLWDESRRDRQANTYLPKNAAAAQLRAALAGEGAQ